MSGRTQPLGWTGKEVKMRTVQEANLLIKQIAENISSVCDGVLLESENVDARAVARETKAALAKARTSYDLVRYVLPCAQRFLTAGDFYTYQVISNFTEVR
jgi:hypothetical protein